MSFTAFRAAALCLAIATATSGCATTSPGRGEPALNAANRSVVSEQPSDTSGSTATSTTPTTTPPPTTTPATTAAPPPTTTPAPPPPPPPPPGPTVSQQNALESAEDYLAYTGFSRSGLIGQLEFEGYSTSDATWAVDHVAVDWFEQAERTAASYLDYTSFSRSGLIDQLIFEGYTPEQAAHGADSVGL